MRRLLEAVAKTKFNCRAGDAIPVDEDTKGRGMCQWRMQSGNKKQIICMFDGIRNSRKEMFLGNT
jgi:hypothetical protein